MPGVRQTHPKSVACRNSAATPFVASSQVTWVAGADSPRHGSRVMPMRASTLFEPVRFDQPLQDEGISADSTLRLRGVIGIKRDQPSRPVFKRAAQVVSQPRTGRRPSLQAAAPIATDGLRRVDSNSSDQQRPAPAHNARTICANLGYVRPVRKLVRRDWRAAAPAEPAIDGTPVIDGVVRAAGC